MIYVSIFDYVDVNGLNIIRDWLDSIPVKAKAKITAILNALEQTDRTEWHHTKCTEVLKGDKDGLVSVKALSQRIQYRILGYDGPNRGEFTLLAPCIERSNRYEPRDIGTTAFRRMAEVNVNPRFRRVRHDFG